MAKQLSKSAKRFLSIIFHIAVLCFMVIAYDAGKVVVQRLAGIKKASDGDLTANAMSKEEKVELSKEIDKELGKLVAKNEAGYVFRTDIPFPRQLKVVVTEITRFKDANMAKLEGEGSQPTKITSRSEEVLTYELSGNALRLTQIQDLTQRDPFKGEVVANPNPEAAGKETAAVVPEESIRMVGPRVGKSVEFRLAGKTWKTLPNNDFKTLAWGKDLESQVESTLASTGLRPRASLFGNKPLPIGHTINLKDGNIDRVFAGVSKGKLDMVFRAVEGVYAHPCAVFDVKGSIEIPSEKEVMNRTRVGEETIESGQIWFSLLYPVVLREEYKKIVSYQVREDGKLVERFQGRAETYVHKDWKVVAAPPKGNGVPPAAPAKTGNPVKPATDSPKEIVRGNGGELPKGFTKRTKDDK